MRHIAILVKRIIVKGNCKCKILEIGAYLVFMMKSEEAISV